MSSNVRVECCKCRGNITAKYFYRTPLGEYRAYCGKQHWKKPFWFIEEVTKEDYLAHKAMEAL